MKGSSRRWLLWFSTVLTGIAVVICARTEHLNAMNGFLLPRRDVSPQGNPKWRAAAQRTVRRDVLELIKNERGNRWTIENPGKELPSDEHIMREPLTDAERALLEEELAKSARLASLYEWLSTAGLMQYVVAPLAVLLSLVSVVRTNSWRVRGASIALAVVALVCVWMMVYRGYASSLGLYG